MKKTSDLKDFFEILTPDFERKIHGVVVCDLLSMVMKEGCEDNIFVTVQNNINSIAVAALLDFSCIVVTSGQECSAEMIAKASEEEITLFVTEMNSAKTLIKLRELDVV